MKSLRFILVLLTVAAGCKRPAQTLPYYNTPDWSPVWMANSASATGLHTVAPFTLRNQQGARIGNTELAGKVYVANFFFTSCPSICPKMTLNLHHVQQAFANEARVSILSHSVMPWHDSVAVLRRYATEHNVGPRWHLLTGSTAEIYTLARQAYFAEDAQGYNKDTTQFVHTERFVLVDGAGHLRGVYNGTLPLETERLLADIRTLLAE